MRNALKMTSFSDGESSILFTSLFKKKKPPRVFHSLFILSFFLSLFFSSLFCFHLGDFSFSLIFPWSPFFGPLEKTFSSHLLSPLPQFFSTSLFPNPLFFVSSFHPLSLFSFLSVFFFPFFLHFFIHVMGSTVISDCETCAPTFKQQNAYVRMFHETSVGRALRLH